MWRSCLCEQRENKEHENDKHGKSDPEADDDGVCKCQRRILLDLDELPHYMVKEHRDFTTAACYSVHLLMVFDVCFFYFVASPLQ